VGEPVNDAVALGVGLDVALSVDEGVVVGVMLLERVEVPVAEPLCVRVGEALAACDVVVELVSLWVRLPVGDGDNEGVPLFVGVAEVDAVGVLVNEEGSEGVKELLGVVLTVMLRETVVDGVMVPVGVMLAVRELDGEDVLRPEPDVLCVVVGVKKELGVGVGVSDHKGLIDGTALALLALLADTRATKTEGRGSAVTDTVGKREELGGMRAELHALELREAEFRGDSVGDRDGRGDAEPVEGMERLMTPVSDAPIVTTVGVWVTLEHEENDDVLDCDDV